MCSIYQDATLVIAASIASGADDDFFSSDPSLAWRKEFRHSVNDKPLQFSLRNGRTRADLGSFADIEAGVELPGAFPSTVCSALPPCAGPLAVQKDRVGRIWRPSIGYSVPFDRWLLVEHRTGILDATAYNQ